MPRQARVPSKLSLCHRWPLITPSVRYGSVDLDTLAGPTGTSITPAMMEQINEFLFENIQDPVAITLCFNKSGLYVFITDKDSVSAYHHRGDGSSATSANHMLIDDGLLTEDDHYSIPIGDYIQYVIAHNEDSE